MKNKLIEFFIFVIFLSLVFEPNLVTTTMIDALRVFITTLFPTIFPFFLISDLLIQYNFSKTLYKIFGKFILKVFHTGNASSFIILMSMVSGFPSGAKFIKTLLDQNLLSDDGANYLITFTHFANPLFVLTITKTLFIDKKIPYFILMSMYLSNFIIGFITRPKIIEKEKKMKIFSPSTFSNCLTNSIKNSIDLIILILGNTCFFFLVINLLKQGLQLSSIPTLLISGFFDLTKGIQNLTQMSFNSRLLGIFIISFISFGGINIHLQVASILQNTKVKYLYFLLGRISQMALGTTIFILLTYIGI